MPVQACSSLLNLQKTKSLNHVQTVRLECCPPSCTGLIQALDPDVFVMDHALGIVGLQSEGAFVEFAGEIGTGFCAGGFVIFHYGFAVDLHGYLPAFYDDVLGPPLLIFGDGEANINEAVKTPSFDPVGMGVVDLVFETVFGPTGLLVFGM